MAEVKKRGRKPGSTMSDEHKAAMAAGRHDARLVKAYLEAIEAAAPKRRGRQRTPDGIRKRLAAIEAALPDASSLSRIQLLQERADLSEELEARTSGGSVDLSGLRAGFVKAAASYSQRKGISYATWREAGVDAATLKEAGISRSS